MALSARVVLFVMSVLTTVVSRILGEDIVAWTPRIIRILVKLAVAWLPEKQQARFGEEWHSHIDEVPGTFGKFLVAAGFLLAASRIRFSVLGNRRTATWLQTIARLQLSHSRSLAALDSIRSDTALTSDEHLKSLVEQLSVGLHETEELRGQMQDDVTALNSAFEASLLAALATELMSRGKLKKIEKGFDRISVRAEQISEASEKVLNLLTRRRHN